MRTLFLHIGFHKTGSSSLQLALSQHRTRLLERGVEFVSLGKKGNSSGAIDVQKQQGRLTYRLNESFEQLLAASSAARVIVSAEHLSFLHTAADIEQVRSVCARYFDEIKVIVYLRRQDRQAMSFKQQAARGCERDRSSSSKLMGHSEGAFPELTEDVKTYYDYCAKLQLWEQCFGRVALRVRDFSASRLVGNDIVTDFVELVGPGIVVPPCRINECVSRKEFLLTHKLIQLGVAPREIEKLKPLMAEDGSELQPSRESAQFFYQQFEDSNRSLDARYLQHPSGHAFSEDFSRYPEQGNDRLDLQDLCAWLPDLFAAGLRSPLGLRDALLVDRLAELSESGRGDYELRSELALLGQCLAQTAEIVPARDPWYRKIWPKKGSGR